MSDILSIIDAISKISVAGTTAIDIPEMDFTIEDAELPLRLLLPSTEGDSDFVGIGSLKSIDWKIQDLCLFAKTSSGAGIVQYASTMVSYVANYLTAVKAKRGIYGQSSIQGVSVKMGPVLWNEVPYWGVNIILTVKEIL